MVITERSLRRLFPPGHPFKLPGSIGAIISGLSQSFFRLRAFFLTITTEAIPFYAVITLPAWFQALGLTYDSTRALSDLQAQADNVWSATAAGQTIASLNASIQKELPQIYLQENLFPGGPQNTGVPARLNIGRCGIMRIGAYDPSMVYGIQGTVTDRPHYNRLLAIFARIASLHLAYIWYGTIQSELALARTGIEQIGLARIGKVS